MLRDTERGDADGADGADCRIPVYHGKRSSI